MEPLSPGPKHWRGRAATARAVAGQLAHPESKRRMFVIAEEYEKLAKRIVIRAKIAARPKLR
jgi:hypothetical protein